MMTTRQHKPLMRCLGEFVGHILKAVKSTPRSREVGREVEEQSDGEITLRRTTIDEIEIRSEDVSRD